MAIAAEAAVIGGPVAGPGVDKFGERDGAHVLQMRGRLAGSRGRSNEGDQPGQVGRGEIESGHAGGEDCRGE